MTEAIKSGSYPDEIMAQVIDSHSLNTTDWPTDRHSGYYQGRIAGVLIRDAIRIVGEYPIGGSGGLVVWERLKPVDNPVVSSQRHLAPAVARVEDISADCSGAGLIRTLILLETMLGEPGNDLNITNFLDSLTKGEIES